MKLLDALKFTVMNATLHHYRNWIGSATVDLMGTMFVSNVLKSYKNRKLKNKDF